MLRRRFLCSASPTKIVPTKNSVDYFAFEALECLHGAETTLTAIATSSPKDNTLPPSPYAGVQFTVIPEFQAIGVAVGQQIASGLLGKVTVDQALNISQQAADRQMRKSCYYK